MQISSWFSWSCQESGSSDLCFCFFMLVCTSHRWRYLSVGNSKAWSRYCLYSGEVKLITLWLTTCVLSSNSSCHKTLKLNFPINRQNMTHWTPLNYHTFFFLMLIVINEKFSENFPQALFCLWQGMEFLSKCESLRRVYRLTSELLSLRFNYQLFVSTLLKLLVMLQQIQVLLLLLYHVHISSRPLS